MLERFKKWLKSLYHQLVEINDTPHRKAMGLALGVFLGIFPGAGPVAALLFAILSRVNRAAALLGSVLTNTWLSIVTLGLAIQVGTWLTGEDGRQIQSSWNGLISDFSWQKLTQGSIIHAVYCALLGFVLISFGIAVVVYFAALFILRKYKEN